MRRVAWAAAVLVGATGCHAHAHTVHLTEAVLHAHIVSTVQPGNHRFSDSYTTSTGPDGAANCRTAANDGNASAPVFVVGAPGSKRAPLYFGVEARDFTGPGVYAGDGVHLESIAAIVDRRSASFSRTPASSVRVRVASDASGAATFLGYRSVDGGTVAATITWTCTTETVSVPAES